MASSPARLKSRYHEPTADSLPLVARQHRHRSERQGVLRSNICNDGHPAEEDVADDLPVHQGHERDLDQSAVTESINEVRLGVTTEAA